MLKRVFAIIISMCTLVLSTTYNCFAFDTQTNIYDPESGKEISFYFDNEEYATINDDQELEEAVDYLIELTDRLNNPDYYDILMTVRFKSGFTQTNEYINFKNQRAELKSMDETHEFRRQLNSFSAEYHADLIADNMYIIDKIPYSDIEIIGYSPFVQLHVPIERITPELIRSVAKHDSVKNVCISYDIEPEPETSWENTLKVAEAYETVITNENYTGQGVIIGVYESGGVCNKNHVNLIDKNITIRDSSVPTTTHATNVVSILSLIAPDAEYYVSDVCSSGLEWLISNGCEIINCSFGYNFNPHNSTGIYSEGSFMYRNDIDGMYDYLINAHFMTVVKSAGNYNNNNHSSSYNPNNKITSPGYAYNAITVGGVSVNTSGSGFAITYNSGASYVSSTPRVKPNVAAVYSVNVPNIGTINGTSFCAPQVGGYIALLLEKDPNYSAYIERIISVVTSTAEVTDDYNASIGDFDNHVGAGLINVRKMLNSFQYQNHHNTNGLSGTYIISKNTNCPANQTLQIALAWLVDTDTNSSNAVTGVNVTDYDLRLFKNAETTYCDVSILIRSNVEMIRYTFNSTTACVIKVYQVDSIASTNPGDWMSLTYNTLS